jgi:K+-sensing histidine kinase KdpD
MDEVLRHYRSWFALGVAGVRVSHEFRNLLMSLMGNISLLRDDLKESSSSEGCLADIDLALKRAIELCATLQTVAQQRTANVAPVDINRCIRGALRNPESAPTSPLDIRFEPSVALPTIPADPFLVSLMLLELIGEARRSAAEIAASRGKQSTLVLHLETELLANASTEGFPDAKPRVVLHARGEAFCPWNTASPLACQEQNGSPHLAIAICRTLMKLFQGEVRLTTLPPTGEQASLYFLTEKPSGTNLFPD